MSFCIKRPNSATKAYLWRWFRGVSMTAFTTPFFVLGENGNILEVRWVYALLHAVDGTPARKS